jgi:hypothetical protein
MKLLILAVAFSALSACGSNNQTTEETTTTGTSVAPATNPGDNPVPGTTAMAPDQNQVIIDTSAPPPGRPHVKGDPYAPGGDSSEKLKVRPRPKPVVVDPTR